MMGEVRYCVNGCIRAGGDKVQVDAPSWLCNRCEDNLDRWLGGIASTWPLLPLFVEHGTTDRNPDSQATKRSEAPAPMRLEIIDLLDTRLGRRWNGLAPAHDRRGVVGTLQVHVERVAEERRITKLPDPHDAGECARFLRRHRLWLAEQEWVTFVYEDVRLMHRQMSDAIGDYRPKPVGSCHLVPDDTDTPCGGPLLANRHGGVHCGKCRATWDAAELRLLGLAQAAQETA